MAMFEIVYLRYVFFQADSGSFPRRWFAIIVPAVPAPRIRRVFMSLRQEVDRAAQDAS